MESAKVSKKTTKSATAPVATTAVQPTVAPSATPAKKASKSAEPSAPVVTETPVVVPATPKKKSAKVAETPSVAPTTTEASGAVTATTADVPAVDAHEDLETLANEMIKMAKRLLEASRQAKKDYNRQVKKAEQGGKRRSRKTDGETSHSNSVFLQPAKISPALASFCGVSADTLLSRTDATRKIAAYIKEHDLQNPENRREIRADDTLTKLFSLTAEDKLNYFNLQRYIKPHFIKE